MLHRRHRHPPHRRSPHCRQKRRRRPPRRNRRSRTSPPTPPTPTRRAHSPTSNTTDSHPQKYGTGPIRPEQGLLRLRKDLCTFGNVRPCNFVSPSLIAISPLKEHICRGVDFTIIRELTGGIYFGERKEEENDDGYAWDTEPYTRAEIERVTRLAGFLAMKRAPPAKVWSLDKANVLATSRLWRKVVAETMQREFPSLELGHHLIDSAAMLMVKDPRALNGVVVTNNLFGDIISDEASVIPGSLGLLPSASLAGVPDGKGKCNGIYEPIHGECCSPWGLMVERRGFFTGGG